LTTGHPIEPIAERTASCRSAWRPDPGRRSTCRSGETVRASGATSVAEMAAHVGEEEQSRSRTAGLALEIGEIDDEIHRRLHEDWPAARRSNRTRHGRQREGMRENRLAMLQPERPPRRLHRIAAGGHGKAATRPGCRGAPPRAAPSRRSRRERSCGGAGAPSASRQPPPRSLPRASAAPAG
jgi:hypothetical protein